MAWSPRPPKRAGVRLAVGVAAVIVAVTAALAVLAGRVTRHAESDLLRRQVAQAGTVLTTQVAVLNTQLADAGQVATATGARPGPFRRFSAARLSGASGMSLSLWRIGGGGRIRRLAVEGPVPTAPTGKTFAAFLRGVPGNGTLAVTRIFPGEPARLGYALRPTGDRSGLVIYAEAPLPPHRRVAAPPGEAFRGLNFAVYLGRAAAPAQLLYSTGPAPIQGSTARVTVPFGNTAITLVGAATTSLTGGLTSALPWIVLAVGVVLAAIAAAVASAIVRRRAEAEGLAADNDRLYRQQRGIAGTLQHALLPDLPTVPGIDMAARYVAGVEDLEVGGDWYDVIDRGAGRCVFVVGDVSGRGLQAATTMAALRFAARAYFAQGDDIADVLTKLRGLLDVRTDHRFATVLIGELDAVAGRLRAVSAGHFPPLLLAGGQARLLDLPVGRPVGVYDPAPAPTVAAEFELPPDGTLLAFSDGLIERRDEVIDTGLERLRATSAGLDGQPLPQTVDELLRTLITDGAKDDTVLLGMRWTTGPTTPAPGSRWSSRPTARRFEPASAVSLMSPASPRSAPP